MEFIADKQTLEDLNIPGKFKPGSVYSLFNQVKTAGGGRLLDQLFLRPLTDAVAINKRSLLFQYFHARQWQFPVSREQFNIVEQYMGVSTGSNYPMVALLTLKKKAQAALLRDEQYGILQTGLIATIHALKALSEFLEQIAGKPYEEERQAMQKVLANGALRNMLKEDVSRPLPVLKMIKYERLLKVVYWREMEELLEGMYRLDVYIAVSDVARSKGLSYAQALPKEKYFFSTSALWHPCIDNAVPNPLVLKEQNMLFLTGANMAGKSTFMKSYGIAVYLAHLGFPVAAKEMEFSVMDGLFSSINVPDNLAMGYSHFYAEVLRVKKVAEEVSQGKNLVVIFDELFKGTNVKDAFDATLGVTGALSRYRNCQFIISTHIIEVGEELRHQYSNIQFSYMPTEMQGNIPVYPYTLRHGITSDRHGMQIIRNEGILDIIKTTSV